MIVIPLFTSICSHVLILIQYNKVFFFYYVEPLSVTRQSRHLVSACLCGSVVCQPLSTADHKAVCQSHFRSGSLLTYWICLTASGHVHADSALLLRDLKSLQYIQVSSLTEHKKNHYTSLPKIFCYPRLIIITLKTDLLC